MMADEAAVLDAPAADAGISDVGTETSAGASGGGDTGTPESIDSADTPQSGETGHLRGAELYKSVKEKLKASGLTPAEQRSLRNAIHIAAKADEATGGDLNKFTAEREAYAQLARDGEESLAPQDLIETVRADREQLADLLADIKAGAHKLVPELFSDHPESAKALTTQAMDMLAETDNERFSNYVARSAMSYFNNKGIAVEFAVLDEFLPSLPDFPGKNRVIQAIQKVAETINGLQAMASKQIPPAGTKVAPQTGDKGADLEQREQNLNRREWNQTAGKPNQQLRDTEMTRAAGARKMTLTDQEKTEIRSAVYEEYEARLRANTSYKQALEDFVKSNNRRGYEKRVAAEGAKLLGSIVARHTNAILDKRTTAAKPAAQGTQKPATAAQPVKDDSGNLVQWIAGPPKTLGLQVDHNRQRPGMMARGEAYIVGQKAMHKWKVRIATMV